MLTCRSSLMVVAALACALPSVSDAKRRHDYHHDHRHDRSRNDAAAGAALGLAIVGIAAAAAANKRQRQEQSAYRDGYWHGGYSPAPETICYREERRCYSRGQYSFEWTDNQFGYDPYRRGY